MLDPSSWITLYFPSAATSSLPIRRDDNGKEFNGRIPLQLALPSLLSSARLARLSTLLLNTSTASAWAWDDMEVPSCTDLGVRPGIRLLLSVSRAWPFGGWVPWTCAPLEGEVKKVCCCMAAETGWGWPTGRALPVTPPTSLLLRCPTQPDRLGPGLGYGATAPEVDPPRPEVDPPRPECASAKRCQAWLAGAGIVGGACGMACEGAPDPCCACRQC
jgi:hypothetical protein